MKIILSLFVLHVVRKACAGGRERSHFYGKPAKSLFKLGSRRFNIIRYCFKLEIKNGRLA